MNKIDVNRQATEEAIQQPDQIIQSQQLAVQTFQTNQFSTSSSGPALATRFGIRTITMEAATMGIKTTTTTTTTTMVVAAIPTGTGIMVTAITIITIGKAITTGAATMVVAATGTTTTLTSPRCSVSAVTPYLPTSVATPLVLLLVAWTQLKPQQTHLHV